MPKSPRLPPSVLTSTQREGTATVATPPTCSGLEDLSPACTSMTHSKSQPLSHDTQDMSIGNSRRPSETELAAMSNNPTTNREEFAAESTGSISVTVAVSGDGPALKVGAAAMIA